MNRHIAIYPGSFDPFTNGHLDIVCRGLEIFDTVIIAVARNSDKNSLFSIAERVEMISVPGTTISGLVRPSRLGPRAEMAANPMGLSESRSDAIGSP